MKLHYIVLSLLTCSSVCAMKQPSAKALREQRKTWIKQIDIINAQMRKGACTEQLVTNKQELAQQMLSSYQQELPKTKNQKRKKYIEDRIESFKTILAQIERSKSKLSKDLTQSVAWRYGIEFCEQDTQRLVEQVRKRNAYKILLRERLAARKKQQTGQEQEPKQTLNTEEKQQIDEVVLDQFAMQRQKFINQIIKINTKLKMALKTFISKEKLLDLYNEKIYLILQVLDNYKREINIIKQNNPQSDRQCIAAEWKKALEKVGAEREKLFEDEQNKKTDQEKPTLDLSTLFSQTKKPITILDTIPEKNLQQTSDKQLEKKNTQEEVIEEKSDDEVGLLSKILAYITFWRK